LVVKGYDCGLVAAFKELWRLVTHRVAAVSIRAWASAPAMSVRPSMVNLSPKDVNLVPVAHPHASLGPFLAGRHRLWMVAP
jgi:hypothetical protein